MPLKMFLKISRVYIFQRNKPQVYVIFFFFVVVVFSSLKKVIFVISPAVDFFFLAVSGTRGGLWGNTGESSWEFFW